MTAPTSSSTLSLHDALPIFPTAAAGAAIPPRHRLALTREGWLEPWVRASPRSEEHTSELQSRLQLVCRLLLEKKKRPRRLRSGLICRSRSRIPHSDPRRNRI